MTFAAITALFWTAKTFTTLQLRNFESMLNKLPRRGSRHSSLDVYSKVYEVYEDDITDEEYEDSPRSHHSSKGETENKSCYEWIYTYIKSQTSLPFLILWAYLYWYLFVMFAFGIKNMPTAAWMSGPCFVTILIINKIQ